MTSPRVASTSGTCTRHHVRSRKEVVEAERLFDSGRQLPGTLHRDLRVVTQRLHPEAERGVRNFDADRAQAHDTKRATRQLEADEALLALLDGGLDGVVVTGQAADVLPGLADISGGEEEPAQHELLDGVRIRARAR